ncbi:hypothetical protein GCM10010124_15140 [Pilimelia terevasa]|uniref:Uncharacterized protein n=1 Tax=Pilimelia terevasa TaxID=53372 RepID=A0A8J3FJG9_9ACTN|nr:hypothetical protein [Pilimelia terevasa]GGK23657.1 hypothetical protein GCM10010124_15140 [Pilimelia terevasa]
MSTRLRTTIMATAAAAGLVTGAAPAAAAPAADRAVPCVQKMSVVNNAGFVLSFTPTTRTGVQTPASDQYPINQYRVLDLASAGLPAETELRPVVSAVGGDTVPGNAYVSFCANGQTATYTATGTTLDYTVTLIS